MRCPRKGVNFKFTRQLTLHLKRLTYRSQSSLAITLKHTAKTIDLKDLSGKSVASRYR